MQFKVFNVSVPEGDVEEMNKFLRSHKIVATEKELINLGNSAYWSFCVQYIYGQEAATASAIAERKEKIDYKEVLDEVTFARFMRLRIPRRKIAESDAVPAYVVFTDAELAEIAKLPEITPKALLTIHGIGEKRIEKYGRAFCQLISDENQTTVVQ
jgi:superfamily II DNA helicase RecQ